MSRIVNAILRALSGLLEAPLLFGAWLWREMAEYGQQVPPAPASEPATVAPAAQQATASTRRLAIADAVGRAAREKLEGRTPSMSGIPTHVAAWLGRLHEKELELVAMADAEDLRDHLAGFSPMALPAVDGYPESPKPIPARNVVSLAGRVAARRSGMLQHQVDDGPALYRCAV